MGESSDSEDQREAWLEAKQRWMEDLHYLLLCSVPEKYVDSRFTLYPAGPRDPERWLPWYRFAAACVLYDPPRSEDLPAFAEYGGPLRLAGRGTQEEPVLDVIDSRRLRTEQIGHELEIAHKEAVFRLMWEHREEFAGLDFQDAWREVHQRYGVELWKQHMQMLEEYNLEIEKREPTYYAEVDDNTSQNELRSRMRDIAAAAGLEKMQENEARSLDGASAEEEESSWVNRISEIGRKEERLLDLRLEGDITAEQFRAKSATLQEAREVATASLEAARARRSRREDFERDREALLEYHARLVPEDLDNLTSEQRRDLYRMMRLRLQARDGALVIAEWGCNALTTLRSSSTVTTPAFKFRALLTGEGAELELARI